MEDIIDIIVTETTNLIEITSQPTDEVIDVNIINNREDITLNVTPSVVEININSLTGNFGVEWGDITGTISNQTDLNTALSLKADLVDGKVPSSQLPSYVDDVVEVANYASLPATGEVGKIYITLDTNFIYRWTGSTYVEIKDSSAVWGAITGTLSSQTDLQNALNLKANDNAVVHNTGNETIAGQKTFTGEVISTIQLTSPTIKVQNSGNASLYSLLLTNSSGIRNVYLPDADGTIALTSNLHNPVTLGTANGLSLSTQVLSLGLASSSANGALSSTDWTTFNNKVSGTGDPGRYAMFTSSSNTISYGFIQTLSNITYVEGLGLSTLNGLEITGNYGGGSGGLKLKSYDESTSKAYMEFINTSGVFRLGIEGSTGGGILPGSTAYATVLTSGLTSKNLEFGTNNTKRLTLDGTTGAATFTSTITATGATLTGALSGTSATFSGSVGVGNSLSSWGSIKTLQRGSTSLFEYGINNSVISSNFYYDGGASNYYMNNGYASFYQQYNGGHAFYTSPSGTSGNAITFTKVLDIASTGAATFSSSITAGGYLMATGQLPAHVSSSIWMDYISSVNIARIASTGNVTNNYPAISISQYSSNGSLGRDAIYINPAGNVGIGTTAPNTRLHTTGSLTVDDIIYLQRASSSLYLPIANYWNGSGNPLAGTKGDILAIGNAGGDGLVFVNSNTERMRITSGGNLLVGTTSDNGTSKLQVQGNITTRNSNSGNDTYTRFYSATSNTILTASSGGAGNDVVVVIEYVATYDYSNTYQTSGIMMASTRQSNGGTWGNINSTSVSKTISGGIDLAPTLTWSNGVLTLGISGSVELVAKISVTYHNMTVSIN